MAEKENDNMAELRDILNRLSLDDLFNVYDYVLKLQAKVAEAKKGGATA